MNAKQKLKAIRELMKKNGLNAYYIPSVDPHQSEYLPECWKRRHWLSGFNGSAGDLAITTTKAALWTDSRYFLQAEIQLAGSGIELMRLGDPGVLAMEQWACKVLKKGQVLGVDPAVMSVNAAMSLETSLQSEGIKVKYVARNLVDQLWKDQPEKSLAPLQLHMKKFAGETAQSKLKRLRKEMIRCGYAAQVIGALDDIAWLFNIRSSDILCTPVAISYAVVTRRGATLYIDERKVSKSVRKSLAKYLKIKSYKDIGSDLKKMKNAKVLADPATTNKWIADHLKNSVFSTSPIVAMRAIKNPVQIEGLKEAHRRDGVALVKFIKWLETAVPEGGVTEMSAAVKLTEFRAEDKMFRDVSFDTISGYAGNGAIVHYTVTPESSKALKPRGLYLVDSGGQYPDGTTDVTRTIALGKLTAREKKMYTLVLKGNINITMTPFPDGMSGQRLEILARQPLFEHCENYGHGTGHGVGHYLGVHEGPMSVSPRDVANVHLQPGQFLSIEPGHYEAGKFGVRIENLAFVASHKKRSGWMVWDVTTLCPIDTTPIDVDLMSPEELKWFNDYHKRVFKELSPMLDNEHKKGLRKKTKSIG
ncbi:aminopeptidase P family protein [bacterium]|nr:aminopeptidase P family protein [bacterium]